MRLKVSLVPYDDGANKEIAYVHIECGTGEQILRWLAYTACSRLSYLQGEVPGCYVPQAVLNQEGLLRDVDTVINELHQDGDVVVVQFSKGPVAFEARWEGRPTTPPFKWGADGLIGVSDTDWLDTMDLAGFGVGDLVNEQLVDVNPQAKEQELVELHKVLMKYGGLLLCCFKYYESQGDVDQRDVDKMTLEQFRAFSRDARILNDNFKPAQVDEIYGEAAKVQKMVSKKGAADASIGIEAFIVGVIHVAAKKFNMGMEGGFAELYMRMEILVKNHIVENIGNIFSEKNKMLRECLTPETELLLKKGRRLTEQTLDSCQLKRVAAEERRLDVKYLCTHLTKWDLLLKKLAMVEFTQVLIFAKMPTDNCLDFTTQKMPLEVNYDEFERLLAGLAYEIYKKEGSQDPFVEFLGEFLDDIFRKAGVLLEIKKEEE